MVRLDRRVPANRRKPWRFFVSLVAFAVLATLALFSQSRDAALFSPIGSEDLTLSHMSMDTWRSLLQGKCRRAIEEHSQSLLSPEALESKENIERQAVATLTANDEDDEEDVQHPTYVPCKHAFIDLGTNIGDSIGYFVDHAVDACSPMWASSGKEKGLAIKLDRSFPRPHLDVGSLDVIHRGHQANPLYGLLQNFAANVRPEDTCVYGVEGNPVFTERLKKLERHVMDKMRPRPVHHLHIHTESVVMGQDGPTKLYLDKKTPQHNFWGSSVLSSAKDAKDTAKENGGELVAADVQGISLTSLVNNTMMPSSEKDGLLMIKMDVEGAEYQVIKDVAKTNILCHYIAGGKSGGKRVNRVVMIVEWHGKSIQDKVELEKHKDGFLEAKRKLSNCGVKFVGLNSNWS